MSHRCCVLLLLLAVFHLSACSVFRGRSKAKRPPKAAAPAPLLVGTITLVNEDARFVLIDSGSNPSPMPGATLKSRTSTGDSGELKAGAIRRRPFAIADVVNGTPKVGDQVFQLPP